MGQGRFRPAADEPDAEDPEEGAIDAEHAVHEPPPSVRCQDDPLGIGGGLGPLDGAQVLDLGDPAQDPP